MAAVLAPLAVSSTALAERWLRPVAGGVARPFTYNRGAPFAAGAHRGADLAAPPGTPVRAACNGRVVHAGAVAGSDEVVSLLCGARRVTHLPLARVVVHAGAWVHAGAPIGTLAAGHDGLHVGVRREGDPFSYEDPMALLPVPDVPSAPAPRLAPRARTPRLAPRARAPRLGPRARTPRLAPRARSPRLAPRARIGRLGARDRAPRAAAPRRAPPSGPTYWPVWAGLAALLCAAAGSRPVALRRRSIAPARDARPAAAPQMSPARTR
jgi:hypothetical protein